MNIKYIKYNLVKLTKSLSINNDISSNNIHITKRNSFIEIELRNLLNIDGCDKTLSKIKSKLLKLDYHLSYKVHQSYGIILGSDAFDIETDYTKLYYSINIHIKKKFNIRKKQPRYLYHGTFAKNIDSIIVSGLFTSKLQNYTEGIHLDYDNLLFLSSSLDYIKNKYDGINRKIKRNV